jgi:hypothetical protein
MNELELMTALPPDTEPMTPDRLADARSMLGRAIANEVQSADRWLPPRRVLVGVAASSCVAAAAIAVALGAASGVQPRHQGGTDAVATTFLEKAATVVIRQPVSRPRPNQFVYAELQGANGQKYRTWQSVNGTRRGVISTGAGYVAVTPCSVARDLATGCAEDAGFLPGMPTNARALAVYLRRLSLTEPTPPAATANWAANDLGKEVDSLMAGTYLLPTQRAALFTLMARTPGFHIVYGVQDAVGRRGVAVRWEYQGNAAEIILNPRSYAYLGDRVFYPGQRAYNGRALLKLAVVNSAPHVQINPQPRTACEAKPKLCGRPSGSSRAPAGGQ